MATLYSQHQLPVPDQIALLQSEGLIIDDYDKTLHALTHISMSRLKGYLFPFRIKGSKAFKPGASFGKAYRLYKFDSKLRKLIFAELEKIEVSIRTQLSLVMSDVAGEFWYTDAANFTSQSRHSKLLGSICNELNRSDDELLTDFRRRYSNPYPPSWIAMEECSFGTMSLLYALANAPHAKRQLAWFYGVSDSVFESWLHSLVYLRNVCAHHGRLWNRNISISPTYPRKTRGAFIAAPKDNNRAWSIMSVVVYMLKTINPSSTFVGRFKALLAEFPEVDTAAMGFPAGWENDPLWR